MPQSLDEETLTGRESGIESIESFGGCRSACSDQRGRAEAGRSALVHSLLAVANHRKGIATTEGEREEAAKAREEFCPVYPTRTRVSETFAASAAASSRDGGGYCRLRSARRSGEATSNEERKGILDEDVPRRRGGGDSDEAREIDEKDDGTGLVGSMMKIYHAADRAMHHPTARITTTSFVT